jgi:4-amino-4-deoxy-L-arabinose transferase-like glycosyltransferase
MSVTGATTPLRTERWHTALLLLILALGAVLRLQHLDAIEHNVDHAYPVWQAMRTLTDGYLPLTAQGTSVLFANPPLTGYLFVPFVTLTGSPVGAYLFVIALNTLAIWFTFRAALHLLDRPRSLIAALLVVVNPWVIEYSRTTWVQSLLPFFTTLVFWLLLPVLLGVARSPSRRLIITFAALGLMTQTYLLAYAILAPVTILLLWFRRVIRWRAVLVGGAIFALLNAPYAVGLWVAREETQARLVAFVGGTAQVGGEAWSHALRLVTGAEYPAARGLEAPIRDANLRQTLTKIAEILLVIGCAVGVWQSTFAARFRVDAPFGISVIWFGTLPLMMSYVSQSVHPFYLLLTLPAGSLLCARGLGSLLRWRVGRAVLVAGLVALTALHAINTVRYAEETLATPGKHGLTALPLGLGMAMTRTLIPDEALARGAVVFADVDGWILNSLHGRLFAVDRRVASERVLIAPANGGVYLRFESPTLSTTKGTVSFADGTAVQRLSAPSAAEMTEKLSAIAVPSDVGIDFLGATVVTPPVPGGTFSLQTYWRVAELKPARTGWLFGAFAHVFDAAGARVAIGDGDVIPSAEWRLGDVQRVLITAPIPSGAVGPFSVRVGQFDGVHSLNAIFTWSDSRASPTIPVFGE